MSRHGATPEAASSSKRSTDRKEANARLRESDPTLGKIIAANPDFDPRAWLTELPSLDTFGTLLFQIIGQQLSVSASRRILDHVEDAFGGHVPGPEEILAVTPERLHQAGLSRRKVETVRRVAAQFRNGALSDALFSNLTDAEIEALLTTIPGIGPWTVHGFLIIALDRPDVVLPGDLALRKVIRQAYGLDHLPTPAEVLALAEKWRPYRSLATAYLFGSAFSTDSEPT
jgi:DNA-3-methyladenine glycosylase II